MAPLLPPLHELRLRDEQRRAGNSMRDTIRQAMWPFNFYVIEIWDANHFDVGMVQYNIRTNIFEEPIKITPDLSYTTTSLDVAYRAAMSVIKELNRRMDVVPEDNIILGEE